MSKTARHDTEKKLIRIHFPPYSSDFREILSLVKTLAGRGYRKTPEPHWVAPICIETINNLEKWGFTLDKRLKKIRDEAKPKREPKSKVPRPIPGLKKEPMPFQYEGIEFLVSRKGRALLGHAMRLGKTVMSLGYLQHMLNEGNGDEVFPVLVVVKASLKEKWRREIRDWMDGSQIVHVLYGRYDGESPLPPADIYIVNYEILAQIKIKTKPCTTCKGKKKVRLGDGEMYRCIPCKGTGVGDEKEEVHCRQDIMDLGIKTVISDEPQALINHKTQRTRAFKRLRNKSVGRIGLSGTPIKKGPIQFFNILNFIAPEHFPSFYEFGKRWCGAVKGTYGMEYVEDLMDLTGLHKYLTETCYLRKTKDEVWTELPDKFRDVIPLPMSDPALYRKAEDDFYAYLEEDLFFDEDRIARAKRGAALTKTGKLKQAAVEQKLPAAIDWIRDFLDEGEKLVIYAIHKAVVRTLVEELEGYNPAIIDGSVPSKKRIEQEDRFNHDDSCRVLVGNIDAAKEGLDFTGASATCFVEMGWSPLDMEQCEDRVQGINQKESKIIAYYLIAEDSVEEVVAELLDSKKKVLVQVLDGKRVRTGDLLTELLKRMRRKR